MDIEQAEKASVILEEIKDLSKYKKLLANKDHGKVAHVAFVQHYGTLKHYEQVNFDIKYNKLFIPVIEGIIKNLEDQIKKI